MLALAQRVHVTHNPAMSQRLPHERPSEVRLHLRDGRTLVAQAGVNRGDDASPYTREELRGKFMNLTSRIWPEDHCQAVLEATLGLTQWRTPLAQWVSLITRPAHVR